MPTIKLKFLKDPISGLSKQEDFFNLTCRHQCFSGGYGNGKSYAASLKALTLLGSFSKYRVAICRYSTTDLKRSTMSTFFKICPPELYDSRKGGNRADSLNYLRLINGSEIFWMHLDDADEATVRGLEVNSVIVDQAEEISENMYDHLKARVGRWDIAEVSPTMLEADPEWPRNPETDRPLVPAYMMILCNPDSEMHWIYRRYHPDSLEWQETFHENHSMIQASSTENPTLDPETLKDMMANDPVWVQRFVYGKWGIPGGAIHEVFDHHKLELGVNFPVELWRLIYQNGVKYRILDHGDASPTCCLWICAYQNWFFVYREYYKAGALISDHRRNITALSVDLDGRPERYRNNWADPSIFKKGQQKFGAFWCTAQEYSDVRIEGPALLWNPADNNELSTRNRINEYLKLNDGINHPFTTKGPAPRLYFIKRSPINPNGCYNALVETAGQKRKQVGTYNGKPLFSDDRDDNIPDHAYDCVRYFCAMHPFWSKSTRVIAPRGSFMDARRQSMVLKIMNRDAAVPTLGSY